ncbi:XkdX family protein [Dorea formicigenerans]|uniref:XkdX family protein n=1 Tax=Dorea formicigenerans TaxID=39486 RepID=UPI0011C78C93|nr:XkdX family protein [Dorea formicigenerans]
MKMLVESLKRMYKKGTLTEEQIAERVTKGSISTEEYEYITGEKYSGGEAK